MPIGLLPECSMAGVTKCFNNRHNLSTVPSKEKRFCQEQLSFIPFWQAMEDHESGYGP